MCVCVGWGADGRRGIRQDSVCSNHWPGVAIPFFVGANFIYLTKKPTINFVCFDFVC